MSTKRTLVPAGRNPAGMKSQHFRTGWSAVGKRQKHKNHLWNREEKAKPRETVILVVFCLVFFLRKIIIKC